MQNIVHVKHVYMYDVYTSPAHEVEGAYQFVNWGHLIFLMLPDLCKIL